MLFCAGREKRIYAVPPHTEVRPLAFEDVAFRAERFDGRSCEVCGATQSYLDEIVAEGGRRSYVCSDTAYCAKMRGGRPRDREEPA
jgi:alpha-D-ribose 1-methylphosphonate 5-phosphate C-P lyase